MSHMYELSKLKKVCDTTGRCTEYELRLQQEQQNVDYYTSHANQVAVTWGFVVGIVGLFILLTPFSKRIKHVQKIIIPSLVAIMPIVVGLVIGLYIGFVISFGTCFKQSCSSTESSAIFTLPLFSLVLTIPLAVMIYRKRPYIVKAVDRVKTLRWVLVGVFVILLTGFNVYSAIGNNIKNNGTQKAEIMNVK